MKLQLTILTLAVLALAKPQAPPDPAPAPPDPAPAPPDPPAPAPPAPPPVPPPADPPADPPTEPSQPAPPPSGPAPVPPPATPAPAPPPDPSPPPPPSSTAEPPPPEGPICECGYTYCSAVLKNMGTSTSLRRSRLTATDNPWNEAQLSQAYCSTPNVKCDGESPASSIDNALFICLCDQPSQKVGNHLEFLCGCDKCLVVKPDYRGRCKTPPLAGKGGKGDGKGSKVRGTNPLGFWM
ncbi:filamentous hemagglutinin [Fusarium sp. NRRL 52700]|nr:filamentous hemagglutinin [Fusarium sp. NRRL 52700]